jgi:hypothetical protein
MTGCAASRPNGRLSAKALAATLACPMDVEGTSVTAQDTSDGAAMVFRTTGDVDALRISVRELAEQHNAHRAAGGAGMPPSIATVEDVGGGARLVLTASGEEDVEVLQAMVAQRDEAMAAGGTCPLAP